MITAMLTAFMAALVLGVPFTLLGAIMAEKRREGLLAGAYATAGVFVLNWILFYFALPTVAFSMDTFWKSFVLLFVEAVVILGVSTYFGDDSSNGFDMSFASGAATMLLGVMLAIWSFAGIWSTDRAHQMSDQLEVTAATVTGSTDAAKAQTQLKQFTDSDPDHIPLLSLDMATSKAKQGMNQVTNLDVGDFHGNAASVYELDAGVFQSVDGHAYYLFPPKPSSWRNSGKVDGNVPFYMQVDAENPELPAVAVTEDKDGNKINIQYSPGGYFGHDLKRYIWKTHHGKVLSDPTLEVDDRGRPFYTLTKDKLTLNRQPTVPSTLIIVDAQTGKMEEKPLDNVPEWVDRVYSLRTAEDMIGWWGRWKNATWQANESSANRYKLPEDEDPVVVYTKGGHPAYQSILTSYNSDTAASYLLMMDARSNKATSYQIPGLTVESVAAGAIRKFAAAQKLVPTHMVLYKVYGQLTWVSPLEGENDENHIYMGTALISATDPNGSSVVIDRNKANALDQYRQMVARGTGSNAGPQEGGNNVTVQGTIAYVNQIVEGRGGNVSTVFYFGLTDPNPAKAAKLANRVFKAQPTGELPELRSIHVGAKVNVTYLDVGLQQVDVGAYDDLGLQVK